MDFGSVIIGLCILPAICIYIFPIAQTQRQIVLDIPVLQGKTAVSLRERILVVLFFMLCCYAGLEYLVLKKILAPGFEKQERQQAQETLRRCTDAIGTQLSDLQKELSMQARSGRLYPLPTSSDNSLDTLMESLGLDFAVIYNLNWKPIALAGAVTAEKADSVFFDADNTFINRNIPGYSSKALLYDARCPLLAAAVPIIRSPVSQTIEGTLVGGRFLTRDYLESLRKNLQVQFNWEFLHPNQLSEFNKQIADHIDAGNPYDFVPLGEQILQASTILYDCRRQPVVLIKTFQDRSISRQGIYTLYAALYIRLIAGFAAVFLLTILLQNAVVKPINKLCWHIIDIGHSGSSKTALTLQRKDEIGILASEFNAMCRRLQEAQVKLMEKSYLSGLTEMSSGILHNVRNALSPITTRIERIKGQFHQIPLANLEQAQQELQCAVLEPQRRQDLMRFVELTIQNILMTLKEMLSGLDELSEQVIQIEDMLQMQRTFGRNERPIQFMTPMQLLEKALEMVPEKFRKECRIQIHPQIKKLPPIPVEPVTFVQVLQNLLINAAESLENEKPLYRKIHIVADVENSDGKNMLHWQIRDNGIGIEAENLRQIFERGASTKRKGLSGIGLHWCANTITAMHGRIWAESPGSHHGATFHILIPVSTEEIPALVGKEI